MRLAGGIRYALMVLVLVALSCKTQKVEIPDFTGPSVGVGTIPLVSRSPLPAPTPAASPVASPAPAPNPTPTPASTPSPSGPTSSCRLGPGSGDGDNCRRGEPTFLDKLESSIDYVVQTKPGLFDLNDTKCPNCFRVKDPEAYVASLLAALEARGVCAHDDGEELGVKNSNDFNDQYDVLTSEFYIRRGDGSYRSTCSPASF
jgi:hypothetical protein